jgi:phosphoribosyl 1,2-cyclic phosphodiesterase
VVDAGTGIRRLGLLLLEEERREANLLFTHAHWDHVLGFPFFRPLYDPGFSVSIFGCPCAQDSVRQILSDTMTEPHFPVRLKDLRATLSFHRECQETFRIGTLSISPIRLSHPNGGIGYKFVEGGQSFIFLTDNELDFQHHGGLSIENYARFCEGGDLLIHDAEFTAGEYEQRRTWGHSSWERALDLALKSNVKQLGLFHHNQERTDHQVEDLERQCQRSAEATEPCVRCFAVSQDMEIQL